MQGHLCCLGCDDCSISWSPDDRRLLTLQRLFHSKELCITYTRLSFSIRARFNILHSTLLTFLAQCELLPRAWSNFWSIQINSDSEKRNSPRMATTMSSFRISIDPRPRKYKAVSTSPQCTRVSPGGAWVVLKRMANARKHPLLAPLKALQLWSKDWLRCRQISACRHSGKPFSTCREMDKSTWRKKRGQLMQLFGKDGRAQHAPAAPFNSQHKRHTLHSLERGFLSVIMRFGFALLFRMRDLKQRGGEWQTQHVCHLCCPLVFKTFLLSVQSSQISQWESAQ